MKKIILLFLTISATVANVFSQDLIQFKNGRTLWVEDATQHNEQIFATKNDKHVVYDISEIVLLEFLEDGLVYFDTSNNILYVDPSSVSSPVYALNHRVYIPFSSTKIAQRSGSIRLRELVEESGWWKVVNSPLEADFILKYVFSDKGKDHAYIQIEDRNDDIILQSKSVGATDWIPYHAGEESAEALYKKVLKKLEK